MVGVIFFLLWTDTSHNLFAHYDSSKALKYESEVTFPNLKKLQKTMSFIIWPFVYIQVSPANLPGP